jgi:uncharacterized membrane protein YqjE
VASDPEANAGAAPRDTASLGPAGRVSASLIEGLHLRFELFTLELGQERDRVVEGFALSLVMALAGFMLLLCANLALLIVFWQDHRVAVIFGLVGFYALVLLGAWLGFHRRRRAQEEPFAATRRVLTQDIENAQAL